MRKTKRYAFFTKYLRWILLVVSILIFIVIIENLFKNEIYKFDDWIYTTISSSIHEPLTGIFKIITNLGGVVVVVASCIIALLVFKDKKYGIYMTLNLVIISCSNFLLKHIFDRPRPDLYRIIEETGYSFPSRTFNGKYGILWIYYLSNLL